MTWSWTTGAVEWWPPSEEHGNPVLREVSGARRRTYQPLADHAGLFRTFAQTLDEPSAVLRFASRFGNLRPPDDTPEGESLNLWRAELGLMRQAVAAWDARGDQEQLHRELSALRKRVDRKTWATYGLEGAERADLSWLTAVVNSRLSGPMSAQIDVDTSSTSFELRLVPNSLLQAMWLQFAESMTTGAEYRPCSVCGEWFLVSRTEGGRRKRRSYCGNACKLWAFRHELKPAGNAEVVDPEGTQRRRQRRRRPRIDS